MAMVTMVMMMRSVTGPNFKPGGLTNPKITRGAYAPISIVEVSEVALRRVKVDHWKRVHGVT